jgi:uncharacterized membrane protein
MKYDLLETIKETIQKIENYPDNGFMYAHLVGILSVYVSEKQLEKILHDLTNELQMKEMSDELKYEMRAGK